MNKNILEKLYLGKKLSSAEIAKKYSCSENKINYWLSLYKIKKRTIAEAIYQKNNPKGDPFSFTQPTTPDEFFLFGLGLGLFWGEGSKRSIHAIKLSNSDPKMIKKFVDFLVQMYNVDRKKLRFQLQIYSDLDLDNLLDFWSKNLSVKRTQFFKTTILKKRGEGTYLKKMEHGVVILSFSNVKLKSLISSQIANIENI